MKRIILDLVECDITAVLGNDVEYDTSENELCISQESDFLQLTGAQQIKLFATYNEDHPKKFDSKLKGAERLCQMINTSTLLPKMTEVEVVAIEAAQDESVRLRRKSKGASKYARLLATFVENPNVSFTGEELRVLSGFKPGNSYVACISHLRSPGCEYCMKIVKDNKTKTWTYVPEENTIVFQPENVEKVLQKFKETEEYANQHIQTQQLIESKNLSMA